MSSLAARPPAPPARRPGRLRRWAPWVLLLLATALVAALLATPRSGDLLHPANRGVDGGQALARVLQDQGVQVEVVAGTTALVDGTVPAGAGTTVLLPHTAYLGPQGGAAVLAALDAADRLVVLVPSPDQPPQLGLDVDADRPGGGSVVPDCGWALVREGDVLSVTDAMLSAGGPARSTVTACYPPGAGHNVGGARTGAVLTWPADQDPGRPETTLAATTTAWTNDRITEEANAALALRLLGGSERLVWVLPQPTDAGLDAPAGLWDLLPRHLTAWVWLLGAATVALAVWRGRRLGPVVAELLPAVVPAAETTRNRGRLYRQSRDRRHALEAVREGTVRRLAPVLGLPRAAGTDELVAAVADATGRPAPEVRTILEGPGSGPDDDRALVSRVRALRELERQVGQAVRAGPDPR